MNNKTPYNQQHATRKTPLSNMLIENLHCFTPEQLEKILTTEPNGSLFNHAKCKFGAMVDTDANDYAQSGFEFFKFK